MESGCSLLKKVSLYKILIIFGLLLCILPIGMQIQVDYRLRDNEAVIFIDALGNKIYNTYYPGDRDVGIMLFHGMGEDQTSLDMFVSKFQKIGYHVFGTDFSGHGRSSGIIPSGENSGEILAHQVSWAKDAFKQKSGLEDSEIFMLGHSMGARGVMKSILSDPNPVNGCILLGASIHVDEDNNTENWANSLGPTNPSINVLIVTGTWEDVFPPKEAFDLYKKLANLTTPAEPKSDFTITSEGYNKEIVILKGITHTHESMSMRVVNSIAHWTEDMSIRNNDHMQEILMPDHRFHFQDTRALLSILEVIGIFLMLIFGTKLVSIQMDKNKLEQPTAKTEYNIINQKELEGISITNTRNFFLYKFLIWLGGLGIAALIGLIFIALPLESPYFTLLFVCPIAGYGIMLMILYLIGRNPGTEGKWRPSFRTVTKDVNQWNILFGFLVSLVIITVFSYFISSFMYHVFPLNIRLFWLVIYTLFATFGFYFLQYEQEQLRKEFPGQKKFTIYNNLLFLAPFVIGSLYILITGSIIYFVDAMHDLIILALVIFVGNLLQKIWKKPIFTAYIQAFLLMFLLLPRGQLTWFF